jgi:hypothetical protein
VQLRHANIRIFSSTDLKSPALNFSLAFGAQEDELNMSLSSLVDPTLRRLKGLIKWMGLKETMLRFSYRRGTPPGLERETLRRVVREVSAGELKSISFRHMSSWKKSGAYRLLLHTTTGAKLTLVYKNALYSRDEIPALAGLPITPGLGEYVFFKHSMGEHAGYLPRVFLVEQLEKGRHYQYVMEDLTQNYRGLVGGQDRMNLCHALPDIHDSFKRIAAHPEARSLLRFDRDFAERLLTYSKKSLEANQGAQSDTAIGALLSDWANFSAVILAGADALYSREPLILIHGDCNITNAMRHKATGDFKILDLEWAGWGMPHQDLVSVLKGAPEELAMRCLDEFSRRQGNAGLERDLNIYRYCGIQRALLDAGFIGMQILDAEARTPNWFPRLIDDSCKKALELSRKMEIGKI